MTFTQTFGGSNIYPADVSYRAVSLTADIPLSWPTELATNTSVVSQIMDVTATAGPWQLQLPPANQASVGETSLIVNVGSNAFTVTDTSGNTIVSIAAGLAYQVYMTDNSTLDGVWRVTQYGAGTSSASAGSLIGAGIKAINTTLNQSMSVTTISSDYTIGDADRSEAFVWTGGAGVLTLPSASTVGNDWFCHVRNSGLGAVSIATQGGQTINGDASLLFNPGDSAIVMTDGISYYTIGFGQSAKFVFDYVSIDLTSQASPYTLSGSNLNRISYNFSGTLTADMVVIVPTTVQQYWISNSTASSLYTITVKTSAGSGVAFAQNSRGIVYCNGADVIDADTSTVSLPVSVANGGTGATSASAARVNLGGTSTGINVFTASSAGVARAAINAATAGANTDITSLAGLTTPLSVAQGGTAGTTAATARASLDAQQTLSSGVNIKTVNGVSLLGSGNVNAIPSGTSMLFIQTAAPTGWTKSTAHNNKALRVVSGTAGSGGTVAFTTAFASQGVNGTVAGTALSEAQLPSHAHYAAVNSAGGTDSPTGTSSFNISRDTGGNFSYFLGTTYSTPNTGRTSFTGSGSTHTHGFTGTSIDLAVQYVDTIIAVKD